MVGNEGNHMVGIVDKISRAKLLSQAAVDACNELIQELAPSSSREMNLISPDPTYGLLADLAREFLHVRRRRLLSIPKFTWSTAPADDVH